VNSGGGSPPGLGLRGFLRAFVAEGPWRLAWVIAVQVVAGLGQAASLLLLVPLLGAVGVEASSGVGRWVRGAFESVGVRPTLLAVLAVFVAVSAVTAVLGAYQSVISKRYELEFVDHLRVRAYSAVARAEWRHLMRLRESDILTVLTSSVFWIDEAAWAALAMAVAVILVCAQLAAAIWISPAMTGLAILTGGALLLIVWPLVRRSRRLGRELVEYNQGLLATATGFLDGLKLVKAYQRERRHVEDFNEVVAAARASRIEFVGISATATAIQGALTALALGVTVYVAVQVIHVPVSSLLVVAFAFRRVVSQLTSFQLYVQEMARGLPAFDDTVNLIAECEEAAEPAAGDLLVRQGMKIGKGVVLNDVTFAYPSAHGDPVEALHGVTLELRAGSLVVLVGPSGSGKTTLADLVAGLATPTAGYLTVGGRRLTAEDRLAWRASVGLVPQDPFLFHDTLEANLRWACPEASEDALWQALQMSNAAEFVGRLPGGLQTVVGDRGLRISGGERQRIALARALLRDPDLLILDEATSSLDTENELAIRNALSTLRGRTTVLVIAHRLTTLREADQIIVLDAGRVVETGTWIQLSQLPVGRLQALIQAGGATVGEPAAGVVTE
jgi:ATP-binding cassette, subfamily C, bacterial